MFEPIKLKSSKPDIDKSTNMDETDECKGIQVLLTRG